MNEKNQTHIIVLGLISFAVLGLIVESLTQGWEFWVPPLLIAGIVGMWALHITQYMDVGFREAHFLRHCFTECIPPASLTSWS